MSGKQFFVTLLLNLLNALSEPFSTLMDDIRAAANNVYPISQLHNGIRKKAVRNFSVQSISSKVQNLSLCCA